MVETPAVVLLSGGMDSAVALAVAQAEGYAVHALTVDYGQRHRAELIAAGRLAEAMKPVRHVIVRADLTHWGGSALTADLAVPTGRKIPEMGSDIPVTYVPARNTIFLSLAMGWAETLGTGHLFIGAHTLDYSGYPDCRAEYFRAFETMANLATRSGVEGTTRFVIHAPLVEMNKTDILKRGTELAVPFHLTISCYQPAGDALSCGVCDACILRRRAFAAAGLSDPTSYVQGAGQP